MSSALYEIGTNMNDKKQHLEAATLESNLKDQLILACVKYKKDYYFTVNKYHELAQAVIDLIVYIDQQKEVEDKTKSLFVINIILALNRYLSEVHDKKFKSQITLLIEMQLILFNKPQDNNTNRISSDVISNLTDVFSQITKNKQSTEKSLIRIFEQYYTQVCISIPLVQLFDGCNFFPKQLDVLSLSEFHNQLVANKFIKPTKLGLCNEINNKQLNMLVDSLIEYPISAPLKINLECCDIKSEGVQVLARYLTSGKTPNNLMLWLDDNQIDDVGAGYLACAISSGKTSANLVISLNKNPIDVKGIQLLSIAIQNKKTMPGLTLFFNEDEDCVFSDLSAKALAESIQSQYAPDGLKFSLSNLSDIGVDYLATAIRSGNAPLNLSISMRNISEIGMTSLIQAVGSGKAPEGTSLILSPADINGTLGEEVAKLIEQGSAPKRLNLTMLSSVIQIDPFVNLIIKALESGNGPEGLTIGLGYTKINDKTKNDLLALLASGKCPRGLQLSASSWLDGDKKFQEAIADLLMVETSIIINYNHGAKDNTCLQRIKFCSLRNKLIFNFPEFENFIKNISIGAHLYNPTKTFINPSSLKISAAFSFLKNKNDVPQTLPSDIIEYMKQLAEIQRQLSDNISRIGVIYG
jgi:hypothetical protein